MSSLSFMQNINKEQNEILSLECKFQGGQEFCLFPPSLGPQCQEQPGF